MRQTPNFKARRRVEGPSSDLGLVGEMRDKLEYRNPKGFKRRDLNGAEGTGIKITIKNKIKRSEIKRRRRVCGAEDGSGGGGLERVGRRGQVWPRRR